ncbi:mas-related G-protein coupled receptor member B2-like [Macrotis lagotis]|uniref:mas-related G-protein coupled receptor member B2-like n=1 Tax=Macrotis lagotis TaxID=92651 RepID=UPI003D698895
MTGSSTLKSHGNESAVLVLCGEFYLDNWFLILSILFALIGLVGNSLVLWFLGFRIRRNPFSIYILNLAGVDALFLCCSFVISIYKLLSMLNNSFLYLGVRFLRATSHCVGLSLLAGISTERCLSVLFPIWYRCDRPKQRSSILCTILWVLPALVWLPFFIQCVPTFSGQICNVILIIRLVWFILVTCVLCVSSLTLLLRVQCSSTRRQPPRLYLLVLLNVLVFLIWGLPLEISDFICRFYTNAGPMEIHWFLACLNCCANPFIYFFLGSQRHRRVRESLRMMLQRALEGEQELGSGKRDTPHTNSLETSF